jgi:hypothetical protein
MNALHSALLAPGDKQALVDALALSAGMSIPAASKVAVTAHLIVAAEMAQLLFAAEPAADLAASAAVFIPPVMPTAGSVR